MPNALELREKRAPLVKRIRELADKANETGKEFKGEAQENWEGVNKEYDGLTAQIEREERIEQLEADAAANIDEENRDVGRSDFNEKEDREAENADSRLPTEEDRSEAIRGYFMAGRQMEIPEKIQAAAKRCGVDPRNKVIDIPLRSNTRKSRAEWAQSLAEYRALSAITGTAGGALVAEGFIPNLEIALLAFGRVRAFADVRRTSEGNDLPWPSMDDTSNEGALLGENKAVSTQDLAFKGIVLHAYKYESKQVKVPNELFEDSAFNLPPVIGSALGERLARIQNRHYTVGDGAAKPEGVLTGATLGVTAASDTAFIYDEIMELYHSIDPAYRDMSMYMMHDTILLALKKLKDGNGNYIWRSGDLSKGVPDTIENKPYNVNQHMTSTITSEDKVLLFGDFSKYKVREVNALRLIRLDELYAANDQVAFQAFMRFDGKLLDAGTNPMKYLQMKA